MASEAHELLKEELTDDIDALTPLTEGYRDWEKVLNKPEESAVKQKIHDHIAKLQTRLDADDVAVKAIDKHAGNDFGDVPELLLSAEEYAILAANESTIKAAMARTRALPEPSTGLAFELGTQDDKPTA